MMMGTGERKRWGEENRRKHKPCLKNHVNENIFILFMLEYQIKFWALDFFSFTFCFFFAAFKDEIIINLILSKHSSSKNN